MDTVTAPTAALRVCISDCIDNHLENADVKRSLPKQLLRGAQRFLMQRHHLLGLWNQPGNLCSIWYIILFQLLWTRSQVQ